jgi:hypothetical protein
MDLEFDMLGVAKKLVIHSSKNLKIIFLLAECPNSK